MNIQEIAEEIADDCGSPYPEIHVPQIIKIIDEYAEQECIIFSKWTLLSCIDYDFGEEKWYDEKQKKWLDDNEVHQLYLKDKNK